MTTRTALSDALKKAPPDMSTAVRVKGLASEVEVYRDGYGIPHVKAETAQDAFFAQGFATAQDRLWQMDYDRRRAYGRCAEICGKGFLEQDLTMRRFQIGATVKPDYQAVDADTRSMLDAYAAGVNAFVEATDRLPIEYTLLDATPEAWQPWDCLAVFKVRHILMGVFEQKLWRARLVKELGPEKASTILRGYQPGHLVIVPPGGEYGGPVLDALGELSGGVEAIGRVDGAEQGSNNWALTGGRTASGKPLMAGDPHRGLDAPNVYYQNHIACPDFDAIGLSFPGCPGFPHFGHNADVAWCVTHANADYQDLYVERFEEHGALRYEYDGRWVRADVRQEVVQVRDEQSVAIDVAVTQHGPIIAGDPSEGCGLAFKYTATAEPNRGSECLLRMLTAGSCDELDESMRGWVDPCNNLLFADVHGDIAYLNRGKVPIRSMTNAWLPVAGWTTEHEWHGHIPFEELPRSRNPDTGYIVTANNRIVDGDYPHYIALEFTPEYRARRIKDRLELLRDATVGDMASIHAERVSIPGLTYASLLARVEAADDLTARARDKLAAWDGTMDRDEVAPTVYSAFRARLHRIVTGALLSPLVDDNISVAGTCVEDRLRGFWSLLVTMARDGDTSLLPPGEDWSSVSARALAEGVSGLRDRLGDNIETWQWGRVHRTRPRHPLSGSFPEWAPLLDPPSVPVGGDGDTPQAGSYCSAEPFVVEGTSVARYVFDTGDWGNSRWISPLGASGHPGSPHYADQTALWADVELIPMLYDWGAIDDSSESHQILTPG